MTRPRRAAGAPVQCLGMLVVAMLAAAACRQERPMGGAVASSAAAGSAAAGSATDSTPAGLVRRYYAAIEARDYAVAYELWGNSGEASGQSRREFADGFAQTARVWVTVTDSTRIGAAAGSQYATVPVRVDAVLRDGREQRFTGTYILRRSMVDGATPEQRRWTIYKASLHEG